MHFTLTRATPEHAPAIAPILFSAFGNLHRKHSVEADFTSPEMALTIAGMLTSRPDMYGVVALDENNKLIGSNFLALTDPVSAVGPITVDPHTQAKGVGRALMQNVIDFGLAHHGPQIRLVQEAINMASLALYTSQGFNVVEPLLLTAIPPASAPDPTVRPLTMQDLPAAADLCLKNQKVSRKNEIASMIEHGPHIGVTPHGRFVNNKLTAYIIPGFFGHSNAESIDDLLITAQQAARNLPPIAHRIVLPTRNADLFRAALKRGFRGTKSWNLMALGPYESPTGIWTPSVGY